VGADLMELCREAGLAALREPASGERLRAGRLTVRPQHFEAALRAVRPSLARSARPVRMLTFADVGGLREAKRLLRLHLAIRFRRPDLVGALGLAPVTGLLVAGPSGCGKTLLVHAAAGEFGLRMLTVDRSAVHSQWFGQSEEAVRDLFRQSRHLAPCLVFVDDIDSIAESRRGDGRSDPRSNVVAQLLHELDQLDGSEGVVVVAATNRPDLVEPSLLRPGRLGTQIEVALPTANERRRIAALCLRTVPGDLDRAQAAAQVAAATTGRSGADIWALVERIKLEALGGATGPRGRARVGNAAVRRAVDAFTRSNGRRPRPEPVSNPSA
jgi:transitional endoplasmic reticulum ATPase